MEITSKRLNLLYKLEKESARGLKYKLSEPHDILEGIKFHNVANIEQMFIDWAHNDIAAELQGVIDDDDIVMEIRIWNRND
tara:strand:+ start:616 stop:858 length:243 start_codon:yes stop_codon:yes gene_type:complete